LPQVVNYPSGSDGTMPPAKPAANGQPAARPATAPMAVMALPSVYSVTNAGPMNPYSGLSADYSASMFGGPAFMDAGFPVSPYAAGAMSGAAYFGSLPPASGYFYTFAPPAVIYRDILTSPLGKSARLSPDGTVVENPVGYVGYSAPMMMIVR